MAPPASLKKMVRDGKSSLAHVLVIRDTSTASLRVVGPFASSTPASVYAYRTCRHLGEEDVDFLPLTCRFGKAVPAHHIEAANTLLESLAENLPAGTPAAQVVVAVHQGARQAIGPFADADEADNWVAEFHEHLDSSPDILPLYREDGPEQPGRAWAGVLESLGTVDIMLRATVAGEYGMHFNDVNEPQCRECEYLPLIGCYGHVCGSDYVEY